MKKQQIFAYACSAALLGTLIGCGQKTEIDQSVPDPIIEVAKTTATSETTSTLSETSVLTSNSSGSVTSSTSSNTTTATTIHYAGNPNLTVRKTEILTTAAPIVTTIPVVTTTIPPVVTEAPTEATTIPETTTTVFTTLVAPNGMVSEEDLRFTFDGISIKPGESSTNFSDLMLEKGYIATEQIDGMQFLVYEELGIKLELVDNDEKTVKSITLSNDKTSTEKGIHIGSTIDEVNAAYGLGVDQDGFYRYLIDTNGDGENDYQLDFAFDGNGLVQSITYCCITVGG